MYIVFSCDLIYLDKEEWDCGCIGLFTLLPPLLSGLCVIRPTIIHFCVTIGGIFCQNWLHRLFLGGLEVQSCFIQWVQSCQQPGCSDGFFVTPNVLSCRKKKTIIRPGFASSSVSAVWPTEEGLCSTAQAKQIPGTNYHQIVCFAMCWGGVSPSLYIYSWLLPLSC